MNTQASATIGIIYEEYLGIDARALEKDMSIAQLMPLLQDAYTCVEVRYHPSDSGDIFINQFSTHDPVRDIREAVDYALLELRLEPSDNILYESPQIVIADSVDNFVIDSKGLLVTDDEGIYPFKWVNYAQFQQFL